MLVKRFERADKRSRVLQDDPDSVVYMLKHLIILPDRHFVCLSSTLVRYNVSLSQSVFLSRRNSFAHYAPPGFNREVNRLRFSPLGSFARH